jgi:hypothetical protein
MGRSEEKTGFWGNTYTVHYDDSGHEIGRSETHEPGFFESIMRGSTDSYEKHYDTDGNYTGKTETHDPDFFESLARGNTESKAYPSEAGFSTC